MRDFIFPIPKLFMSYSKNLLICKEQREHCVKQPLMACANLIIELILLATNTFPLQTENEPNGCTGKIVPK